MTGSERHAKWAMTALALAVGVEDPELYLLQDRLSESLRVTFNSAHIVACTALLMNRPAILREVELDEVIAARVLQALIAKQNVGAAKAGEKKKSDGETLVPMTKLSDAMRAKVGRWNEKSN